LGARRVTAETGRVRIEVGRIRHRDAAALRVYDKSRSSRCPSKRGAHGSNFILKLINREGNGFAAQTLGSV
jgi:hypothetical protein